MENAIEHGGQYTITVPLGAVLKQDEKVKLFAAIRSSQDDCVAGGFLLNDGSVTFHREVENDCEFIVSNFTNMAKTNYEAAAMHQLAGEIMDSQPANEHLLQIVEALRGASGIQPRVENLRNPSQLLGNVLISPRFQAFPMDEGNDQWGVRDASCNKCWSDDGWQLNDSGLASVLTHEESLQMVNQLEHELLGKVSKVDFDDLSEDDQLVWVEKARAESREALGPKEAFRQAQQLYEASDEAESGNVQDASHAQLFSCTWPCQFEGAKFTTMTRIVVDGAQPAVVAAQKWMHGQFVDFSNPDEFSYLQANVVELHKAQDDPIPWGLSRIDQAPEWSLTSKVPERYDSPSPGM